MTLGGAEGTLQMAARGFMMGETILGCQTGPSVIAGVRQREAGRPPLLALDVDTLTLVSPDRPSFHVGHPEQ